MADMLDGEDVLFSVDGGGRHIRIPVLLDADEYVFLQSLIKERGISASSFFRTHLTDERRRLAHEELSRMGTHLDSAEHTHEMNNGLAVLAKILKPYL
jgi:hypothetical protein